MSFLPAFLDMVKNVAFSQRGKISPTSLDKMALVSAKIKIQILNFEKMALDIKSQKFSNPFCKPFFKYSQIIIGVDSTVHSPPPLG